MWTTALGQHPMPLLQWGVVLGASLGAAVVDARTHRIPNLLTFPLLLGGLASAAAFCGLAGLGDSFGGAFLLALPYVVLFAFGGGGAGDAKIMGALGAWLGVSQGVTALLSVCVAGVALALLFAFARRRLQEVGGNIAQFTRFGFAFLAGRTSARTVVASIPTEDDSIKMPYGVAILAGSLIAFGASMPWSH